MGGLFLWRRGGSSTTKERQVPQRVRVRMDPSLRGTCVTPNNTALFLIHMHCMAHGNGVVGGWHMREADVAQLRSLAFPWV